MTSTAEEVQKNGRELAGQTPSFSVVIPAYNAASFILETLDSVARQTYKYFEIVVVDDGSVDGTYEAVRQWCRSNPTVSLKLISQTNKGIGGARNSGVRKARGEFVAFLDADDYWLENKLASIARYLGESPKTDLVCHDEWIEKDGCRTLRTYGPYLSYKEFLFKRNCISTGATIIRRSMVAEAGWFSEDLGFNGVEDYEFWMRVAKVGAQIEYLHEVLGVYRIHEGGISSNVNLHTQNALNVLNRHFSAWPHRSPYYRYLMRKRRAIVYRGAARSFSRSRDFSQAKSFAFRALQQNPLSWKNWLVLVFSLAKLDL